MSERMITAVKHTLSLTLTIEGPFLHRETAPRSWGIDAAFSRDYLGHYFIDRSHIKGKLREACIELELFKSDLNAWFGSPSNNFEPQDGRLLFDDFYYQPKVPQPKVERTVPRTALEDGVNVKHALMMAENGFPSGKQTTWTGNITFFADAAEEAASVADSLLTGFRWIEAFGSEKGIGFGKLLKVKGVLSSIPVTDIVAVTTRPATAAVMMALTVTAEEPLLLGGVQRKTNYMESDTIIHGGSLKGALAEALNRTLNPSVSVKAPIDSSNASVSAAFPKLAEHFASIRFLHGFPTKGDKRPVCVPDSAVVIDRTYYDVAHLNGDEIANAASGLPAFPIDWKGADYSINDDFGWAVPKRYIRTRTAIDRATRKAADEKLFSFSYACPVNEENAPIVWRSAVSLEKVPAAERPAVAAELKSALQLHDRLGKRKSKVRVTLDAEPPLHCQPSDVSDNGLIIVTLQTDALMVNHADLIKRETAEELKNLYAAYWKGINSALELKQFFAHQTLQGGYLNQRFRKGHPYYPFYLTSAGSVFVLEYKGDAKFLIKDWTINGLSLPAWAKGNTWKNNPFMPENGYGEVVVNLTWQLENQLTKTGKS